MQANDLVTEVFYNGADHPLVDAINFNSYRARAAAQTISLHMGPSRAHATIVAFSSSTAEQQPGQQQWQSLRQQVGCCDTVNAVSTIAPQFWTVRTFQLWLPQPSYRQHERAQLQLRFLTVVIAACAAHPAQQCHWRAKCVPVCHLLRPAGRSTESHRCGERIPDESQPQHCHSSSLQARHTVCHDHQHGSVP